MSSPITVRVARLVVVGALAALSFGAQAGELSTEEGSAKTVIGFSDLDLSKEADARVLYSRLQRASSHVCDGYSEVRDLRTKQLFDACYQDTLARAVEDVGHASVKAAFAADNRIRVAKREGKALART